MFILKAHLSAYLVILLSYKSSALIISIRYRYQYQIPTTYVNYNNTFYHEHPLDKTAREKQFRMYQRGWRAQHMEDDVSVYCDHERKFSTVIVWNDAAHHCHRYITVHERAQYSSASRRVPFELAILYRYHWRKHIEYNNNYNTEYNNNILY